MGRKYSKVLTIILIIIIVAVVGLLGFLGFNYYSNYRTNKDQEKYFDSLEETVTVDAPTDGTVTENPVTQNSTTTPSTNEQEPDTTTSTTEETTTTRTGVKKSMYKGFYSLGTIEIPKTNVKAAILEKVTRRSLETSVAVIWPTENAKLNSVGNIVIVGHNYRNGLFFSNNKKLSKGDKIYIKDLDGNRVTYVIYNIFETSDTDTSFYNRDTDGKREITLSTCTDDSKARLIIEAREQ